MKVLRPVYNTFLQRCQLFSFFSPVFIYGSEFWTMYNWVQTWGKFKISEVLRATYLAKKCIFVASKRTQTYWDIPSKSIVIHYWSEPSSRQPMGVNVHMRLYNGCTENWNITVQNLVIIFLWGVSLSVLSVNCIIKNKKNLKCLKSEKTSWICWKYCTFFVPFFLFSLIF